MPSDPFFIIVVIAVLAVVVVLMVGLGGFAGGGAFNKRNGNKIMRLRIAAQFVAVLLILAYVYFRGTTG
ncbi:MAG: preprotein translocase subunit SecG [Sulfitobacter sp.]|jgi:preprotein translocase subunit SecG